MNTKEQELLALIRQSESMTLEFKSDAKCLPDRELVAAVVALANSDGGKLLLGVEDDGEISGLHANHFNTKGLPALIAIKRIPLLSCLLSRLPLMVSRLPLLLFPVQGSWSQPLMGFCYDDG